MSFLRRFFSSTPQISMEAAKTRAQQLIDENAVMVFSKSYCPYCRNTKNILKKLNANFGLLELDQDDNGSTIQDALQEMTGQRTVPNIFIGKKHIGGNSDLEAKKGKELEELLRSVGAIAA